MADLVAVSSHTRGQLSLVGGLVQLSVTQTGGAQCRCGGDDDQRHGIGARLADGGGGVTESRTTDQPGHGGTSAGTGMAVRHEHDALFVPGTDVREAAAGQRGVQWQRVVAGQAEHAGGAIGLQQ